MSSFIKSLFTDFREDKQNSISQALSRGNCFFVFGLNSQGQKKKIIAAILFSASEDGIWINWIGVAKSYYDTKFFGKESTGESFRRCGLGSLVILLAQICSISLGWSLDVYLQANQLAQAVSFYKIIGFTKAASNTLEELPETWCGYVNSLSKRTLLELWG